MSPPTQWCKEARAGCFRYGQHPHGNQAEVGASPDVNTLQEVSGGPSTGGSCLEGSPVRVQLSSNWADARDGAGRVAVCKWRQAQGESLLIFLQDLTRSSYFPPLTGG